MHDSIEKLRSDLTRLQDMFMCHLHIVSSENSLTYTAREATSLYLNKLGVDMDVLSEEWSAAQDSGFPSFATDYAGNNLPGKVGIAAENAELRDRVAALQAGLADETEKLAAALRSEAELTSKLEIVTAERNRAYNELSELRNKRQVVDLRELNSITMRADNACDKGIQIVPSGQLVSLGWLVRILKQAGIDTITRDDK